LTSALLSDKATTFLNQVLESNPRIAAFDCDGTLWSGDSGADFFYWEIAQGLIPPVVADWARRRYDAYHAGTVDELTICGEMVTIHNGIPERAIREAARAFFVEVVAPRIFPEMLELARQLEARRVELWAVSSTNNWVVEEGAKRFGIPAERVLAACVAIEHGVATDRLTRVPTGPLKADAIREVVGRPVDAVFGNSVHDLAMLEIARRPFAINPNADLARAAAERGWTVYWPDGTGPK